MPNSQFRIEPGVVSFYFPDGDILCHIRQADDDEADIVITQYGELKDHVIVSANQVADWIYIAQLYRSAE